MRIPNGHLDTRAECVVEGGDAVGRQEENARVVLQHTEKDADDCVAVDAMGGPALERYVCFVENQDNTPDCGEIHYLGEVLVEVGGGGAHWVAVRIVVWSGGVSGEE